MAGSDAERIVWYAASNGIARMGPYPSEVEAWKALRAAPAHRQFEHRDSLIPKPAARVPGVHVPGAYVWPEVATR